MNEIDFSTIIIPPEYPEQEKVFSKEKDSQDTERKNGLKFLQFLRGEFAILRYTNQYNLNLPIGSTDSILDKVLNDTTKQVCQKKYNCERCIYDLIIISFCIF